MPLPIQPSFYYGPINFKLLTYELRMERLTLSYQFDYRRFISLKTETKFFPNADEDAPGDGDTLNINVSVPLIYNNETGSHEAMYYGSKLNERIAPLKSGFYHSVFLKFNRLYYELYLLYQDAPLSQVSATSTQTIFTTEDGSKAAIIGSESSQDIVAFVKAVEGDSAAGAFEKSMMASIASLIQKTKDAGELKSLYEQAPTAALIQITDDEKLKHMDALLQYDKGNWIIDGWFKDSSNAMVKLITSFADYEKIYAFFYANPEKLIEIYDHLSVPAEQIFCDFVNLLCQCHQLLAKQPADIKGAFTIGGGYGIKTDLLQSKGTTVDLANYKYEYKDPASYTTGQKILSELELDTPTEEKVLAKGSYHPMDFIQVTSPTGYENMEEAHLLPAIYVKYLVDSKKWEQIAMAARVCADLLVIILSIASLGSASPLAVALGVVDGTMAAGDLAVAANQEELEKTEEGRAFLEKWNAAMLIAGAVTAAPAAFALGTKLLLTLKNVATIKTVKAMLLKLVLEVNITNFERSTVRLLEENNEIIIGTRGNFNRASVAVLWEQGCLLVAGEEKVGNKVVQKTALIYKGEIVAIGDRYDKRFLETLEQLRGARYNPAELEALLESLLPKGRVNRLLNSIEAVVKGKKAIQISSDLDELYNAAKTASKELEKITKSFAKETNGVAGVRPKNINGGLKGKERALEKVNSEYGGDASRLLDIAGSKVVYESVDDLYLALEKFNKRYEIIKFKDRIQHPLSTGYRDILMNVKMSNGHIIEFRLHLKAMDEAADMGHKLYEEYRTLEGLSNTRSLTIKEKLRMQFLEDEQSQLYNGTWNKINLTP